MEKKKILLVSIFLLGIVLLGAFAYQIYLVMQKEKDEQDQNTQQSITKDDFIFEYSYSGENHWKYTITGTLPNPCYMISTSSSVAESYPEQVLVTLAITPPKKDQICIQVIKDVYETGEFTASEKAIVSFKVENK